MGKGIASALVGFACYLLVMAVGFADGDIQKLLVGAGVAGFFGVFYGLPTAIVIGGLSGIVGSRLTRVRLPALLATAALGVGLIPAPLIVSGALRGVPLLEGMGIVPIVAMSADVLVWGLLVERLTRIGPAKPC